MGGVGVGGGRLPRAQTLTAANDWSRNKMIICSDFPNIILTMATPAPSVPTVGEERSLLAVWPMGQRASSAPLRLAWEWQQGPPTTKSLPGSALLLMKLPSVANLPGTEVSLKKVTFSFKSLSLGKPNKYHLMITEGLQDTVVHTMTSFDSSVLVQNNLN